MLAGREIVVRFVRTHMAICGSSLCWFPRRNRREDTLKLAIESNYFPFLNDTVKFALLINYEFAVPFGGYPSLTWSYSADRSVYGKKWSGLSPLSHLMSLLWLGSTLMWQQRTCSRLWRCKSLPVSTTKLFGSKRDKNRCQLGQLRRGSSSSLTAYEAMDSKVRLHLILTLFDDVAVPSIQE